MLSGNSLHQKRRAALPQVDDGQPDLPSGGHGELPCGGQCDYLV
jgi:hypothetical protein